MDKFIALAERVEAAVAPDRVLDRDIAVAVYGLAMMPIPEGEDDETWGCTFRNLLGRTVRWWRQQNFGPVLPSEVGDMLSMTGWSVFDVPPFTASVDASMTLIRKPWHLESLSNFSDGSWSACLNVPMEWDCGTYAKSAACAVTAACLRSMTVPATSTKDQPHDA